MRQDRILLAHGSGGTMMRDLIEDLFIKDFDDDILSRLDDAAPLDMPGNRIAMSTDTFVVSPLFFPGGDIGRLAVCGTVNDVATSGATPLYLSVGFVLEEGFAMDDLERILISMRDSAAEAGVRIVTGDTKVVEKGHGDGIYINTAGVGALPDGRRPHRDRLQAGRQGRCSRARSAITVSPSSPSERASHSRPTSSPTPPRSTTSWRPLLRPRPTRAASAIRPVVVWHPRSTRSQAPPASRSPSKRTSCPYGTRSAAHARCSATTCSRSPTRARWCPSSPPTRPKPPSRRCAARPTAKTRPSSAKWPRGLAGKVYVQTGFGAKRIMDMLVGEQLPRIC